MNFYEWLGFSVVCCGIFSILSVFTYVGLAKTGWFRHIGHENVIAGWFGVTGAVCGMIFVVAPILNYSVESPTPQQPVGQAYKEYVLATGLLDAPLVTTEKGHPLELGMDLTVYYDGLFLNAVQLRMGYKDDPGKVTEHWLTRIPDAYPLVYGDIDLRAHAGVPVKLLVVRADPLEIRYVVVPAEGE